MAQYQGNESDEECQFEDANEDVTSTMDLPAALADVQSAMNHFLDINFENAREIFQSSAEKSVYHSLSLASVQNFQAVLTFDPQEILKSSEILQKCLTFINQFRHKSSIPRKLGRVLGLTNYDSYTALEVHAELCYADVLLMQAQLSFIEDETLTSFLRSGLKVRTCFNIYQGCNDILNTRKWKQDEMFSDFESGVRLGSGSFNVLISLLPSRVIKLLEFIGFSGNREAGLQDIEFVATSKNTNKQMIGTWFLLAYHLFIVHQFSERDGNLQTCEELIKEQLNLHPNSVWYLFFKGRLEFMKGDIEAAKIWYDKALKCQKMWIAFHHMCYWELFWSHVAELDWLNASYYADSLLMESRWSKAVYGYQKAASLLMLGGDMKEDQKLVVDELMRNAPDLKQKLVGKSIPMEKFALKRAHRYFAQNRWLCLPGLELLYLWSFFKTLKKDQYLLRRVLNLINETLNDFPVFRGFVHDNRSLLMLLKGSCLRIFGLFLQAEECLMHVIDNGKKLKEDTFLVPFAVYEMALLFIDQEHFAKARTYLDDAKKKYTGYSLQSRLVLKIQSTYNYINEKAGSSS